MKVSYEQGTPCWVELGTSDQEAAKAFYHELFGWSYVDHPMDEHGHSHYSMAAKERPERRRHLYAPRGNEDGGHASPLGHHPGREGR